MHKTVFLFPVILLFGLSAYGQGKFSVKFGPGYDFSFYNYARGNNLENLRPTNKLGLLVEAEYHFTPILSIQGGINIIRTEINFNDSTLVNPGKAYSPNVYLNHNLNLAEFQIPITLKITTKRKTGFNGYAFAGIAYRRIAYAKTKISNQQGTELTYGNAYVNLPHKINIAPVCGIGIEYKKKAGGVVFFAEGEFEHLSSGYVYGGMPGLTWVTDDIIENSRFIVVTVGISI